MESYFYRHLLIMKKYLIIVICAFSLSCGIKKSELHLDSSMLKIQKLERNIGFCGTKDDFIKDMYSLHEFYGYMSQNFKYDEEKQAFLIRDSIVRFENKMTHFSSALSGFRLTDVVKEIEMGMSFETYPKGKVYYCFSWDSEKSEISQEFELYFRRYGDNSLDSILLIEPVEG